MMRLPFALLGVCAALVACTPASTQKLNTAVAAGQSFCAVATAVGPAVVALVNAADDKAVTVTGKTAAAVAAGCALVNGIPVMPPADPAQVPAVAVKVAM